MSRSTRAVRSTLVLAASALAAAAAVPLATGARGDADRTVPRAGRETRAGRDAAAARRPQRVVREADGQRSTRGQAERPVAERRGAGGPGEHAAGAPKARTIEATRVPRPRVSPGLRELGTDSSKALSATTRGGRRGPSGSALVELVALPGRVAELTEAIETAGGETIAVFGASVRAELPVEAIDDVVAPGLVRSARLAREGGGSRARVSPGGGGAVAKTGAVLSEGVALTGASNWLATDTAPFGLVRATPVRVAILDIGFEGWSGLLGSELPPDTAALDFAPGWDVEGCIGGLPPCIPDGTAMAEIVADMAPSADLTLVAVDPNDLAGSMEPAIDFLRTSGPGGGPAADVIVSGLTWQPGLYGDAYGEGPVATLTEEAAASGIVWINDVGDRDLLSLQLYDGFVPDKADHWHGGFADSVDHFFGGNFDSDGYMDTWFSDDDPQAGETWLNGFCLGSMDVMLLDLVWDDWDDADGNGLPSPGQDYSIDVYEDIDGSIQLFDSSAFYFGNEQTGVEGEYPWDSLDVENLSAEPVCFFLAVFAEAADGNNRFHLYWGADNDMTPGTVSADFSAPDSLTEGNRLIPADAVDVVSIAATALDDSVEPFTTYGLPGEGAPLLCAPDDVSTVTLGGSFLSSFGAAHAAGAVALMMNKVSTLTTEDALTVLDARARDILGAATDPRCGSGRMCMTTTGCP